MWGLLNYQILLMKYLHFPPDLDQTPIRLTTEEMANPQQVVSEFFRFYNLNCVRLELGNWLEYAFSSDDPDLTKGNNRVNLMQFSYQLEAMLEAAFLLYNNPGNNLK